MITDELARLGIELDLSRILRLFFLIFARLVGMGLPLPFFGGQLVPARIRFGIPLFLAAFLYPFIASGVADQEVPPIGLLYVGLAAKELFVGYAIGFIASLPFHAVSVAGAFMDTQRGTTFATVIAPLTGGHASLLGQFLNLYFIVIFLTLGGAHLVIEAVGMSYGAVPLLGFPSLTGIGEPYLEHVLVLSTQMFAIGVQVAGPVVIAMFLTDATLGIVNRAAPNIQVFFLGLGLKAVGGLLVLFISLGYISGGLARMVYETAEVLRRTVGALAGGAG